MTETKTYIAASRSWNTNYRSQLPPFEPSSELEKARTLYNAGKAELATKRVTDEITGQVIEQIIVFPRREHDLPRHYF